jgi:carbonic anhydrase
LKVDEIIQRLKEGNQRYVADKLDGRLQNAKIREQLTEGQSPYSIVLSCADSRVIPELIFDTELGELFTVRVAGNIANTSSIASIEYAVTHLNSKVIVVLGHESCGAVAAAIAGGDAGYNLNHLLAHITPAKELLKDQDMTSVIKKNAEISANQLVSRSPIISEALHNETIKIIPAYYHLDTGTVDFLQ